MDKENKLNVFQRVGDMMSGGKVSKHAELSARNAELENLVEEQRARIEEQQAQIEAQQAQIDELEKFETQNEELQKEKNDLRDELDSVSAEHKEALEDLQSEIDKWIQFNDHYFTSATGPEECGEAVEALRHERKRLIAELDEIKKECDELKLRLEAEQKSVEEKEEQPQSADTDQSLQDEPEAEECFVDEETMAIMAEIDEAINKIKDNAVADTVVSNMVSNKIIANDYYGWEEFTNEIVNLRAADSSGYTEELKKALLECLGIESATWVDNLYRLRLYENVDFLVNRLRDLSEYTEKACEAFERLLQKAGIELIYPRLFSEKFDEETHQAEAIKNITMLEGDLSPYVDDEETVVDLYAVGYSVDGEVQRKPMVSRLNK